MMAHYLKGAHKTLDSWRPGRTNDGWRLFHKEMLACSRKLEYETTFLDENLPARVRPMDMLASDLFALKQILEGPTQDRC